MGDLFHPEVPFEFILRVWATMGSTPWHTYQVLTKRPERMAEITNSASSDTLKPWRLRNVWLGTSVEDQATVDERIPHLLRCPAAVRFVSYEPALGPVDFWQINGTLQVGVILTLETVPRCLVMCIGSSPAASPGRRRGQHTRIGSAPCATSARRRVCRSSSNSGANGLRFRSTTINPPSARKHDHLDERYLNLASGEGFHGDAVIRMRRVGKRATGHLLDGVGRQKWPKVSR